MPAPGAGTVTDALVDDLLDAYVPRVEQLPDWDDVRRRARRGRGRRIAVAAAVAVLALGGAPALAVLLRDTAPQLPKAADRSAVFVVLQPRTGRVIVEAAPWKGRDGVCYLILRQVSGCSMRSRHGAGFFATPPGGYTFDPRIAHVTAILRGGRRVPLALHRLAGRLQVTFFTARGGVARGFELRDARGVLISRVRLP